MADRPIIFSAPMVRALLAGTKTQTRRIFVPPAPFDVGDDITVQIATGEFKARYQVGDRLWVRETVAYINNSEFGKPSYWEYRADTNGRDFPGDWPPECKDDPERPRWKPAIHMPRTASRLILNVTDVKIERLQDISETDAFAEGVETDAWDMAPVAKRYGTDGWFVGWSMGAQEPSVSVDAGEVCRKSFASLWNSINDKTAWDANPFVVGVSFDVVKANIDALSHLRTEPASPPAQENDRG